MSGTVTNWYVAEVARNREAIVAFTLRCLEIEPFLPLELDTQRVSARTKTKELIARPALPGYLFFCSTSPQLSDVRKVRDVLGILDTPEGDALSVSLAQMDRFIDEQRRLIEETRLAYYGSQAIFHTQKAKWRKMSKDLLREWMIEKFGLDAYRAA